jgi:23S rRNA (pseudouridine1915-N3)-methyltransferase
LETLFLNGDNMNIKLICVGKVKEAHYRDLIQEYSTTIRKNYKFEIIELPDEKTPEQASEKEEEKIKELEGMRIMKRIPEQSLVVPLCIEGKQLSTAQLKTQWNVWKNQNQTIVFVIGGSLGLSQKVVQKGNLKLSFSKMTFPHQLMRVILLEQLARL